MNVHSSSSGLRRAAARRALRRYGGVLWAHMPSWPFRGMLRRIDAGLLQGTLELHLPDGMIRLLGGREQGFSAIVHLDSWRALARLATGGSVGWYRAWSAGEWSSPDPVALFALFMANARSLGSTTRATGLCRIVGRFTPAGRGARRAIADLRAHGDDFFPLWLDESLTYSCARPAYPSEALEAAQHRKMDELLARIDLKDGDQLLEIDCGWGALAERALDSAAIGYTGLTQSSAQRAEMLARPSFASAGDRVQILSQDYRDIRDRYDAIIGVETVEALGQRHWPAYLASLSRLLKPGGRAAIQFVSIDDAIFPAYARHTDFVRRFIAPGGCLISEKRFRALAEAEGLIWTDQTRFGLDYAWTLRQWRERFEAALDAGLLPRRFDAHFVDLWRYFLMYSEGGFVGRGIDVSQVTLVKPAA